MISNQFSYITENSALAEVISLIRQEKLVALDTEFMREKTYYPVLSLIQVALRKSGEQQLFVIDALSDIDLTPFLEVIFDRNITKILHAPLQDLQIFCHNSKKDTNRLSADLSVSVIDTQIMSNFCGFNFNVGYSFLVENFLQKKIDKSLQRSDWQKRPLSDEQIEYAVSDVIFLEEIYHRLAEILRQKNRGQWYEEEMRIFMSKTVRESKENLFKNFSFKGRSAQEIAKIQSLILWREDWAKKLDLPRQHFMRDYVLERVVYAQDFDLKLDAQKIAEIKEIMEQDFTNKENAFLKEENVFMNNRQKDLYKKAKELMTKIAAEENLKEQLLITSHALRNLICTKKPIEEILMGWRYELYGDRLKKLIST